MKAVYITADGKTKDVKPINGDVFTLQELQDFVGGYIEFVYLPKGMIMVVNEEGKLNNLPFNNIATGLYPSTNDVIVGNVLLVHESQVN